MTRHTKFSDVTGIPVYFCDAYCPGAAATRTQRAATAVLPQKDRPLDPHRRTRAGGVAELNSRPRAVLGWQTPVEVFSAASVALIA
jgi:IS30 family transposase